MNLSTSTALVTGGAVRIGRAICKALADHGCNVVVHYNRSEKDAGELAEELGRKGVRSFTVKGDLSSEKDCKRIVKDAFDKAGQINILINNAAVFHKYNMETASEAEIAEELQINYHAPVMLTEIFASNLKTSITPSLHHSIALPAGKVINLLDRRIIGVDPECLPYQLSKKKLAEFTRSAALEFAPHITVNGVAPGAVLPPRSGETAKRRSGDAERVVRDKAGEIPMRHAGTPEDVAAAIVFLLEADAVTGQVIFVDGGQHLVEGLREEV
ncbi:SDR family oxidoreductase [Verrucomicrobiota bacterium]